VKPVDATSPNAGFGGTSLPTVTIDGSGLSFDLVTGDAIPGAYPTHTSDFFAGFPPGSIWEAFTLPVQVTYDLGAVYDLTGFHLWNGNQGSGINPGISAKETEVSFSTTSSNSGFGSAESLSFTAAPGTNTYTGEDYSLSSQTTARWVRFDISSNHGSAFDRIQLAEVRFIANDVIPEPTTLVIWSLLATLGLSFGWRRRRRAF
jgi:hypothetical protein